MRIINQYSFVVAAVSLIGLLAILVNRARVKQSAYLILVLALVGIFIAWYFLRPISSVSAETAGIQAQIGNGVPVLIEFQSPY